MGIEDILFPKKCYGCGVSGSYLCNKCKSGLNRPEEICPECEKPSVGGWVHGRCRRAHCVDRLVSVFEYRGIVQKMLKDVKFRSSWKVMKDLAVVMVEGVGEIQKELHDFSVVSVPMWEPKERKRGFNQAEILAEKLTEKNQLKYEKLLGRNRETKSQYGLSLKERRKNITGSFELRGRVKRNKYIIVDDVWTTGSTIRECAKVLKRNGAKEVWGLVLAR